LLLGRNLFSAGQKATLYTAAQQVLPEKGAELLCSTTCQLSPGSGPLIGQ